MSRKNKKKGVAAVGGARHKALLAVSVGAVLLFSAFLVAAGVGLGVYMSLNDSAAEQPPVTGASVSYGVNYTIAPSTATTTSTTSTSSSTTTSTSSSTSTSTTLSIAELTSENLRDGDTVDLWEDSVGFHITITNPSENTEAIEVSAVTGRGDSLNVTPASIILPAGASDEIFIQTNRVWIPGGGKIIVGAAYPGYEGELSLTVKRHSEPYIQTVESGLSGCGAWALRPRVIREARSV